MTAAFVVLLTFFVGTSSAVKQYSVKCPDMACVDKLRKDSIKSPALTRFQVWRAWEFSLLPDSKQSVWTPIIDETRL